MPRTYVRDDAKLGMRHPLPRTISRGRAVISTDVMFDRRHLPGGVLSGRWFPLLVHPETDGTVLVPSRYWSDGLLAHWRDEE